MNSLEFAKKPRIMQGCSKHVDGFSDTSSAGSILDEADREVSRLTERAFKSLCVAQEGMCNDLGMTSSPSAASGNQASELPDSDRSKRSTGKVKISNIIQKQPKEAPETFQKLIVQCSVEDEDSKGRTGNGFPRETLGSSQKLGKQKSKISSLIEAFDQSDGGVTGELVLSAKQVGSGHSGLPEESQVHNITQWDSSALVNMHKEKSSFSAACQEHYWLNCKKRLPPAKSSKTSVLSSPKSTQYRKQGCPTDTTVLKHPVQTLEDSPSKKAGQLRTPGNFLHSERSAFKSWHDHSRFLFEEGDHVEKLSLSLQPSGQVRNLCDDGARCRRAHPLVQARVPPNEAKTDLTQKPVNCSPSGRDSDSRSFVPEANHSGVKESAGQGNSLQDIKPQKDSGGGTIENEDEGRGFQLWRSSRNPQFKKQMDSEVVSGEVVPAECHLAEVSTLAEQRARRESPSFSISKLLTPNIGHSANGAEVSPAQPMAVTPPLIQLPVIQGDEGRGGDYQLRESYKSKASSLLYNLKDVRKRVKSTYTSSVTPQSLSEQSKNKEYIFQNIHQTNERTSSAPLRLGTRENYTGDSCDQEKPNKVPNAVSATPTARSLSKAETIHRAEPDTWKNDDYLNVRSPQTVKEAGSYPSWRTRNTRPRSAMVAAEVHVERGLDRKVACQLNKLSSEGGATNQKRSALARNSPEDAKAVLEKTEERRNRSHRSRKPECPLFSQVHKAGYPNENHFRMQDDGLASQRPEETYRPMLEANVPSNGASSHPATQDLKLSNHSYFTLGGDHCQDTERVMADHSTGGTRCSLSGCPTAEVLKDIEKYELQYYALSDPAMNSEGMDEHQSRTPRDLTGHRAKGDSPLDMLGEEKFDNIFSKQEIHGQGNITNPPRPTFKIKDNMLKTSPVTKSAKSTIPKPVPGGVDVDLRKETPDMSVSEGTPGCDKLDSEEMGAGRSVAMNPRPDSTCSVDSKTAGKPPVVPPKSEKALRRAKKLATRKKRTDGKQKKQGGDETETDPVLSNTPEPSPCVPVSQTPIACSPVPMLPMDSCVIPAVPNIMALNSTRPLTSVHSFPLSQRKLLQDPESGQYFFVDIPIQVQTKTLYDPETDKYFQVSIPSTGRNASLDFFNNSYVLYPGFLSFPLTSVSVLRPHSHMSAPAILLDVQEKEAPLNEWTNTDLTCTGEQGDEPYIETLFDPQNDTQCSAVSSQLQPEGHNLELIVMGDLEDIATENN